jgi:hypothetical protein
MEYILLSPPYKPLMFVGVPKRFTTYGASFFKVTNVYLSGVPYLSSTFFNPFSAINGLSATYPGFTAIQLQASNYISNNDNTLTFTAPSASSPGFIDVIVQNEAGYGILTQNVQKNIVLNPYTSGSADYNNFTPYVMPWAKGIEVI